MTKRTMMSERSWKLSGELAVGDAERLEIVLEDLSDLSGLELPTLSRFEQPNSDLWQIDVFFGSQPPDDFVEELLDKAGLFRWQHTFDPVEDRDWVSESQKLLAPVRAGRFLVYGAHDADKIHPDLVNLQVDAGQAFGTGKHETTAACLTLLDAMGDDQAPTNFLDLGTGSGVLALAASRLWPAARGTATDIDPIATDVATRNADINNMPVREVKSAMPGVAFKTADGLNDPDLQSETPYDVIIANILAGPLVAMASDIVAALAPGGVLILSGLLITQQSEVMQAYQEQGLQLIKSEESGEWNALQLAHSS